MKSYRFARRSFLSAVGGAVGLHTLLRTMEASAAGAGAPPRFLLMNWPCGSVKYPYVPMGTGTGYTASTTRGQPGYIISPFATPELKPHTHVLFGFNMMGLAAPGPGGAHEAGTPFSTTGASSPGVRKNGGETDDGCAGGPSWDQILLQNAPELKTSGRGYYNVICDSRVDSYETSTRCLSYGYAKQQIASAVGGGMISENTPLRPTLSPITAYNDLFSTFTPGGGGMTDQNAVRLLKQRKSVLDHSTRELERLKTLAPANERVKIDAHAEIIRKLELQLSEQINNPGTTAVCTKPAPPAMNLNGVNSDRNADYGNPTSTQDDAPNHAAVGAAHSSIIRAAFACDILRVATFEWSPGTNHVSFKGADPNSPNTIYMHHPLSHRKLDSAFYQGSPPTTDRYIWDAMAYVQWWYFNETAKFVLGFLNQVDPLATDGASLLDRTVIAAVSEVGNPSHDRNNASALIIGGSKLGMQPGGFQSLTNSHHNRVWASVAQAFLGADPLSKLTSEAFYKNGVTPIPGVWAAPT
jgi:Protein of unknown function (DUF1552)